MKILSIGNSFSQDAHRYLHAIAESVGKQVEVTNLYIGGCRLSLHHENMMSDARAYALEKNGVNTGKAVSIREAFESDAWDVVTLQQQSSSSACYKTFQPYLSDLAAFVRKKAEGARLALHQTWAYADESEKLYRTGYATHSEMFVPIRAAYEQAMKDIEADFLIPSGETMRILSESGFAVHRDGFHASYGLGRFALALTWLGKLTDADLSRVRFADFDSPVSEEQYAAAIAAADSALSL
ncbi:MAG: DUF4886 domain-containing protein [Clostridia bacterium]|nr:DUF4886 domain-containing protein [Clostridia bacterium]